jgi:hypothetical protein
MRAPVRSADDAIAVLGKIVLAGLSAARRRGQLSHALFVRPANVVAGRPASNARRGPGESLAAPAGPTVITLWLLVVGILLVRKGMGHATSTRSPSGGS